jgi:glycosyltransferase involved in cell wall biosynthesis
LLPEISNGVDVDRFGGRHAKRGFALALGRICPEKGFHIALDAARQAGVGMLLAGQAFGYEEHERYFQDEIAPRLDARRRFIGPVSLERKRRLLAAARCLLVPSLCPETSSLVAMEALASGTPVIAFPNGALAEIVEHGRTGFLVRDEMEMTEAIAVAGAIDPAVCREEARRRFSAVRTAEAYMRLYEDLAGRERLVA